MSSQAPIQSFTQLFENRAEGTALCLEFANTLDWHASAQPVESLHTYADLLVWAHHQDLLSAEEQAQLACLASTQPAAALAVLANAIELREAIYHIFVVLAKATEPAATDLATLNQGLAATLPYMQLQPTGAGRYGWTWTSLTDTLAAVLRPIALSAAILLTSDQVDRVKQCEDDRGCGFLFIDTSKNRSRRWCSMESCGNRAKVQRHRHRSQSVREED